MSDGDWHGPVRDLGRIYAWKHIESITTNVTYRVVLLCGHGHSITISDASTFSNAAAYRALRQALERRPRSCYCMPREAP